MNKLYTNKFMPMLQAQLWKEFILLNRFTIIGCIATVVHITFAWILINFTQLPSLLANLIAYITAFSISFTGNFYWTFSNPGSPFKSLKKFLIVSIIAFIINTLALSTLLNISNFDSTVAIFVAACIIPIITFIASRLWVYKD